MSRRTPRRNIRILRQPEVTEVTGLSRTTIWRPSRERVVPPACAAGT